MKMRVYSTQNIKERTFAHMCLYIHIYIYIYIYICMYTYICSRTWVSNSRPFKGLFNGFEYQFVYYRKTVEKREIDITRIGMPKHFYMHTYMHASKQNLCRHFCLGKRETALGSRSSCRSWTPSNK